MLKLESGKRQTYDEDDDDDDPTTTTILLLLLLLLPTIIWLITLISITTLLPCVRTTDRDYTLVTCRTILELTIN